MEPLFTVDCERFVPNRFALVHVAAARARSLKRGAEPRVPGGSASAPSKLALREIAAGALAAQEIESLLMSPWRLDDPAPSELPDKQELRDGMSRSPVVTSASLRGKHHCPQD